MPLLAVFLATVFLFLAALHVYWGFGGKWGGALTVPQDPAGRPLFTPGRAACFAVAIAIGGFAHLCLAAVALAPLPPLPFSRRLLIVGLSALFAARTVGDFRYFGFFRRVRDTGFARLDRICYTPLCAALTVLLLVLAAGTR